MEWKKDYLNKLTTADNATTYIKSGDTVVIGHACAEPTTLVNSLIDNKDRYKDVELIHMVAMGKGAYTQPEMSQHFRHKALFVGGCTRTSVIEGRADYTPCFFYEVPSLFKENYIGVDVSIIQVSPPDAHGYCSYGVSVDYTKAATESAKLVIAEINNHMPRTIGDSFIHVSEIDHLIESSYPLIELSPPSIGEIEKKIGAHCASLVEDGSTLQLGIGAIPDAVLMFLKDKKDLGIHSEMLSDGIVDLYNAGVVNNSKKTIHKDKMIATFLMGTQKLYDFVHDNPVMEMRPVDYVNHPTVIMQNHKMVSINSCIQVDLMGQVASESIGLVQFTGVGGQVDYVRGATMAKDGKSIIAMPSTAASGKVSRIAPFLDHGAAVTTSRNDVNYVVTEYGIAHLKGKSLKDRGRALINIAHPDFKESLITEWEKRFNDDFEKVFLERVI